MGLAFDLVGDVLVGRAAVEKIPAAIRVNTVTRISFFTILSWYVLCSFLLWQLQLPRNFLEQKTGPGDLF